MSSKVPASVLYGNFDAGWRRQSVEQAARTQAFQSASSWLPETTIRSGLALDLNRALDSKRRVLFRLLGGMQQSDGFTAMTESERRCISPMITLAPSSRTELDAHRLLSARPLGRRILRRAGIRFDVAESLRRSAGGHQHRRPGYEVFDRYQRSVSALFRHAFNDQVVLQNQRSLPEHRAQLSPDLRRAAFATTGTGANRNTDFSTITRGGGGADEDFDTLTADTSIAVTLGSGRVRHGLLAGVDYQNIEGENFQQFNTGVSSNPVTSIPNLSLFAPTYGGVLPTFDLTALAIGYVNTESERDQVGLYLQDQISIDRLQPDRERPLRRLPIRTR